MVMELKGMKGFHSHWTSFTCLLLAWMKKDNIDPMDMKEILSKKGGMIDWFGTADAYEIEKRGIAGDKECEDIYNAMALSIARAVSRLACYVGGKVDMVMATLDAVYLLQQEVFLSDSDFVAQVI